MKRTFFIPFLAALLGGGIAVAVVAAFGGLSKSSTTVTTVQDAPAAPSNASQVSKGLTPHEIYVRDAPGVAYVTSTIVQKSESPFLFGQETQRQGVATGSGIVIDGNGTILTNYHVVENAIKVTVSFEKGKAVEAQVVGKDPSNDLAVLRISTDGLTLHPLALGDSSAAQVGDPVYAIGNPFNLERTLTTGVVSALQREITAPTASRSTTCCRPTRRSTPATRGAAARTRPGQVIGINSQIETGGGSGGSVGIGFAVPINTAKSEIAQLEKGGTVRGAYLGLTSLTIDGSLSALNLPVKSGALVQSVQKGTAAEKAGIKGGSVNTTTENGQVTVGGDIIVSSTARLSQAPKNSPTTSPPRNPATRSASGSSARSATASTKRRPSARSSAADPTPFRTPARPKAEHASRYRGHRAPATVGGMSTEPPKIKICGITNLPDAELSVELGAWTLGMIFYDGSPRRCSLEQAQQIVAAMRRRVELCGVFVNAPLEEVVRVGEELGLTMLQLHGDEGPSFCEEARRRTGARIVKAAQVSGAADVQDLERFHVDFHLLDARARRRSRGRGCAGGRGRASTGSSPPPVARRCR
jgi:S1-C subfamily serine protease